MVTTMSSSTREAFFRGLLAGMAAPITAFAPAAFSTPIDSWVMTPSYRPQSEDKKNIQRDFDKVLARVSKEISSAQNSSGRNR